MTQDAGQASEVGPQGPGSGDSEAPRCAVGTSDDVTHRAFVALADGATIPMVGAGQSGLFVELGVRWTQFTRPSVTVSVRAEESDRESTTQPAEYDTVGSSRVSCEGEWCAIVPFLVRTGPLVDDPYDLRRLPVSVTLTLEQGIHTCHATLTGFLERREPEN